MIVTYTGAIKVGGILAETAGCLAVWTWMRQKSSAS